VRASLRRDTGTTPAATAAGGCGKEILALTDPGTVTVIEILTGQVLAAHDIDPARGYWRNKQQSPGRWPGPTVT
jgi:hypothetical protein